MNGLAFAIVGHLIGDYILQDDWQAQNKKKSSLVCGIHCALWTGSVMVCAFWFAWWVPVVLFITHFAQDRTVFVVWWMHRTGKKSFAQPPLAPWSIIVVDNVLHTAVLMLVAAGLGIKS